MQTKDPFLCEGMVGGMSRAFRPHLLPKETWYTQFNMRTFRNRIVQIKRKRPYLFGTETAPITAIVNLPLNDEKRGYVLGFGTQVSRLNTLEEVVAIPNNSSAFIPSQDYNRWATVLFENRCYFTNPDNGLRYTDAQTVNDYSALEVQPAGKYIETFYDHLFIANVSYNGYHPNRILWSDLRSFGRYKSTRVNEADYYDFLESDSAFSDGVTGVKKMGTVLVVYTPTKIHIGQYVGLPNVMKFDPISSSISNDFPYSLVDVDRYHFFLSEKWQNIFCFDGDIPKAIGDDIADLFFEDLTPDPVQQQKTYGYLDPQFNEIWWVYISRNGQSAGKFDKAIVFNLLSRKWYTASVEDYHSFISQVNTAFPMDRLAGTANGLVGTANSIGGVLATHKRIWGGSNGLIMREEEPADTIAQLVAQPLPYLETADYHFGNIEDVKEMETMQVQAGMNRADTCGVRVKVATKWNVDDKVRFKELPQTWRPGLREKRLSGPRTPFRIIRFGFYPLSKTLTQSNAPLINSERTTTFQPVGGGPSVQVRTGGGVRNFEWTSFLLNIYGIKHREEK